MKSIDEIVRDYTSGKCNAKDTNQALKEAGAGYNFQPGKNELTEEEIWSTTVGSRPEEVTGWGLLDTGTGTLEKIHVVGGRIEGGSINTVDGDGHPHERAIVYIGGQTWQVYGDELGELEAEPEPWWAPLHTFVGAVPWRQELPKYIPEQDMMDRPKYHGQEVVKGALRYIYDDEGHAKYQPKSMRDYDKDHGRA